MALVDRLCFIVNKCVGKRVLDLGCIGPYAYGVNPPSPVPWLHDLVKREAIEVIGVDIDETKVHQLREQGYDIRVGNVYDLSPIVKEQKFDVIIAGELIEHLSNPGIFLDVVRPFLKEEGELIITTPNPFHYLNPLFVLIKRPLASHTDHVAWYDAETIKTLAIRHRFVVSELHHYNYPTLRKSAWLRRMVERFVFRLQPRFAPGLLIALRKSIEEQPRGLYLLHQ